MDRIRVQTQTFLTLLDCKVALISCGYKNKYGHPSVETLKTLENLHINTLCTSDCGSIAMYSLFHFFICCHKRWNVWYNMDMIYILYGKDKSMVSMKLEAIKKKDIIFKKT